MSITPQERELIIIGAAVACGCKASIRQDMLVANQLHMTDRDIKDAIAIAIDVRRRATDSIETFIASDLVDSMEPEQTSAQYKSPRNAALVSVGAAFAVNCAATLNQQVVAARVIGIDEEDLAAVVSLSAFIKDVAASHVERMMNPDDVEDDTDTLTEYRTPFGPERCAWAAMCKSDAEQAAHAENEDLIRLTGAL